MRAWFVIAAAFERPLNLPIEYAVCCHPRNAEFVQWPFAALRSVASPGEENSAIEPLQPVSHAALAVYVWPPAAV